MAEHGKDFKENLKELKNRIIKGDTKLENSLRRILRKPLPKEELFKKYPKLEDFYNQIKNNPADEADLDFEIEDIEKTYFNDFYIEILREKKKFDFSDIDYEDLRLFAIKIATKVKSYEDEDGILKKIDKFNNIDFAKLQNKPVKIAKVVKKFDKKITPIRDSYNAKLNLMLDGYDPDIDDAFEFENERKKLMRDMDKEIKEITQKQSDEIDEVICKILSVKKEDFTEWGFNLFRLNCLAMIGYNSHIPFTKGEL